MKHNGKRVSSYIKIAVSVVLVTLILFSSVGSVFALDVEIPNLLNNDEFGKAISGFIKKTSKNSDDSQRVLGKADGFVDFSAYGAEEIITAEDGRFMLTFDTVNDAKKCVAQLSDNNNIIFAETDSTVEISAFESNSVKHMSWGPGAIQTDKLADALKNIDFGRTATVAVVDSGSANIGYLKDHIVAGYDYVDNDSDPSNDTSPASHGTFISSIIVDNTSDLPVEIMPVRVIEYETATLSNIANGIYYATDHGADVINLSLGGPIDNCKILDSAVEYALSKNKAVVIAAGNESENTVYYCPAHIEAAITVSAINSELEFDSSYSNYGNEVDFAAPGTEIKGYDAKGGKIFLDGTSMSAGFISACFGILKLLYPGATVKQLESALADSAENPLSLCRNKYYGYGIPQMMFFSDYADGGAYLVPEEKNIVVGDSYSFNAYNLSDLSPVEGAEWTSSDEEVASVDANGKITALKIGETEITCTVGDKISKCIVSVKEIKNILVSELPKYTGYVYKKSHFEPLGIEITVNYADGTSETVSDSSKMSFEGFDANKSGRQSIKVRYFNAETEFDVVVGYTFWQWIIRILLFGWIWY